ncbi:MAG TPA: response regulator transcription factor [Ktedonobacteraceae bacterium]|jgi:DNA-binding NarL/FixJ family response regulator|nr:response regulator transcription factor [Ktedonobacteraceae bacterium]
MAISILIVDDYPLARVGLRQILERNPAFRVLGEAATGSEAIQQAQLLRPDVVLMDINLPDQDGISVTATVCRLLPNTRVVALAEEPNLTLLNRAVQTGVGGYLLKEAPVTEIYMAIQDVMEGRIHLSPRVTKMLIGQTQLSATLEPLTGREQEVLQLLARGASNKEVMQALQITEATVKAHIRHVFSKLGAESRTQAILVAMRLGLLMAFFPG